jgi:hypothetical protein
MKTDCKSSPCKMGGEICAQLRGPWMIFEKKDTSHSLDVRHLAKLLPLLSVSYVLHYSFLVKICSKKKKRSLR